MALPPSSTFRAGLLLVLCVAAAIQAQTLAFDFSHLDDDRLILDRTAELSSWANAPKLFREAYSPFNGESNYFRPLVDLSFMLDARLPIAPGPFHRTNVALHVIACGLFWSLVVALGFSVPIATAVALLFAVHPVAVSAVAWIPGRNDSLLACSFLGSWLAFLWWRKTGTLAAFALHLALLLAALLTKETAVVLAPLLWAFEWARDGRPLQKTPAILAGWAGVLGVWWLWRHGVPLAASATNPDLFNVGKQLLSLLKLAGKAFLPLNLSPLANPSDSLAWPGVLAVAAVGAAIWACDDRRFAAVAAGAFVLLLLPTLISPTDLLLECRLYLPLCCLLLVLASLLRSRPPRTAALLAGTLAAGAFWGIESVAYAADYRDPLAVGEACVRTAPDLAFSYMTAGMAWTTKGAAGAERAAQAFRKALELDPKHLLAHNDLAVLAMQRGAYAEAETELQAELAVNPNLEKAHLNLGIVRRSQGDLPGAVAELKRAVALEPSSIKNLGELYVTYRQLGDQADMEKVQALLARRGFVIHGDTATLVPR